MMALALVLKNSFARAICDYCYYRSSVQNSWTLVGFWCIQIQAVANALKYE